MSHVRSTALAPRCVLRLGMAIVFAFLVVGGAASPETRAAEAALQRLKYR